MKLRIFLFILECLATSLAQAQATKQPLTPNLYELKGGNLHATYSTTGKDGQPYFSYQDGNQTLSFKGKEIRQEKSEAGTLVSVTLRMTVDSGSTTFTLLVPAVRLVEPSSVQIHTIGIETVHKFSVVPPANLGQIETYTTTELSGEAKVVLF